MRRRRHMSDTTMAWTQYKHALMHLGYKEHELNTIDKLRFLTVREFGQMEPYDADHFARTGEWAFKHTEDCTYFGMAVEGRQDRLLHAHTDDWIVTVTTLAGKPRMHADVRRAPRCC